MPTQPVDPYAPPPMHHDRSGAIVRLGIVAVLLGAAAWGYMSCGGTERPPLVAEVQEEQQLADASGDQGYAVSPATAAPETPFVTPAPAPAATPRAAPRRVAPTAPRSEPTPDPVITTPAPPPLAPVAPTPLPPDVSTGD